MSSKPGPLLDRLFRAGRDNHRGKLKVTMVTCYFNWKGNLFVHLEPAFFHLNHVFHLEALGCFLLSGKQSMPGQGEGWGLWVLFSLL